MLGIVLFLLYAEFLQGKQVKCKRVLSKGIFNSTERVPHTVSPKLKPKPEKHTVSVCKAETL